MTKGTDFEYPQFIVNNEKNSIDNLVDDASRLVIEKFGQK